MSLRVVPLPPYHLPRGRAKPQAVPGASRGPLKFRGKYCLLPPPRWSLAAERAHGGYITTTLSTSRLQRRSTALIQLALFMHAHLVCRLCTSFLEQGCLGARTLDRPDLRDDECKNIDGQSAISASPCWISSTLRSVAEASAALRAPGVHGSRRKLPHLLCVAMIGGGGVLGATTVNSGRRRRTSMRELWAT